MHEEIPAPETFAPPQTGQVVVLADADLEEVAAGKQTAIAQQSGGGGARVSVRVGRRR